MKAKDYIDYLISLKETIQLEFKASLRMTDQDTESKDLTKKIVKTITAFANTRGGKILVGYHERRNEVLGIQRDKFLTEQNGSIVDTDRWQQHLNNFLDTHCTYKSITNLMEVEFVDYDEGITCAIIKVERVPSPKLLIAYTEQINGVDEWYSRKSIGNFQLRNDLDKRQHLDSREGNMPRGWSINPSMLFLNDQILDGNWKGDLVADLVELNNLPDEKGLYVFHTETKAKKDKLFGSLKTILYVGKSADSIKDRAKFHLSPQENNKNYIKFRNCINSYGSKLKVSYLELPHLSDLNIRFLESQIIDYFSPPLNNKRESQVVERSISTKLGVN